MIEEAGGRASGRPAIAVTRLARGLVVTAAAAAAVLAGAGPAAAAHLAVGIPHVVIYVDDQGRDLPPVLELRDVFGPWTIDVRCSPVTPAPGQPTEIQVRIRKGTDGPGFAGTIRLEVFRRYPLGLERRVLGPESATASDGTFLFHPVFPAEARYHVVLGFSDGDEKHRLRFTRVVGKPGSGGALALVAIAGGVAAAVVVALAIRARRTRRRVRAAGST